MEAAPEDTVVERSLRLCRARSVEWLPPALSSSFAARDQKKASPAGSVRTLSADIVAGGFSTRTCVCAQACFILSRPRPLFFASSSMKNASLDVAAVHAVRQAACASPVKGVCAASSKARNESRSSLQRGVRCRQPPRRELARPRTSRKAKNGPCGRGLFEKAALPPFLPALFLQKTE